MKELYLTIKVFIVHILIRLRIIKSVWYQCELDLADIRAEKLYNLFWGEGRK